jgi:hypothetical protein
MMSEKFIRYLPALSILGLIFFGNTNDENWVSACYVVVLLSIIFKSYDIIRTKKSIVLSWSAIYYIAMVAIFCVWSVVADSAFWSYVHFLITLEAFHRGYLGMPDK